jgi:hypothetical protein
MAVLKNTKDERFAQLIAKGYTQADAYREVYFTGRAKEESIYAKASEKAVKVRVRVKELQEEAASEAVCSAREMQERLSDMFRTAHKEGDRDGAVKVGTLLAKITGAEAAAKIEVRNGGVTDDYRAPPHVLELSDEELAKMIGR